MTTNCIRVSRHHDGTFYIDAKVGYSFKSVAMNHNGQDALAKVAELLGIQNLTPAAHGAAVADAFNLQRIEQLTAERDAAQAELFAIRASLLSVL